MREWDSYIDIPYKERGRTREGLDCWGLVRLVYAEQYGRELPSFDSDYDNVADQDHLRELMARNRETWVATDMPATGDVVVFRILGQPTHVGVIVAPGLFLHVREGGSSVIERLDSTAWRKRIEGYYRYSAVGAPVSIMAAAHPLKTERNLVVLEAGATVEEIVRRLKVSQGVAEHLPYDATVWVNGRIVTRDMWEHTIPSAGSHIELRAVARGSKGGMLLLTLAVVVAASVLAPHLAPVFQQMGMTQGVATSVAFSAISFAGQMLMNSIFPVRPPRQKDPGSAERQLMMQGAANTANQYGAIPVVLGRFRFAPPAAAQPYTETTSSTSYLHLALLWGYGRLQISDLRIGDTALSNFEEVEVETLQGYSGESTTRFHSLYGQDVEQLTPQLEMAAPQFDVVSASRTSNVVTVTTKEAHGIQVGNLVSLSDGSSGTVSSITATTFTFPHTGPNGALSATTGFFSTWQTFVLNEEVDRIKVTLHFPEGLRTLVGEGRYAGDVGSTTFRGYVQVRQLDSNTLTPITGWGDIDKSVAIRLFVLPTAWYNTDDDAELEPVYQWHRFSVDPYGKIVQRSGSYTTNQNSNPSGTLLTRLQNDNFGFNAVFERLPDYGPGEEPLWDVCVYGNSIISTVDKRSSRVSGCAMAVAGMHFSIDYGSITRADSETVRLGAEGESFYKRKDAFSHSISFDVAMGKYEVRVRRSNTSESEFKFPSGNQGRRYHAAYLQTITGYSNRRPVVPPKPLSMTAMRIKATNQLNGNIQGITGTAQTICLDWDNTTKTWIERATRNPASLLRYVLQHPGNAKRCTDAQLDLPAFQTFHDFCRTNKFTFDGVYADQRSLWDVMLDVAAAGRASPTRRDGKWTVIIDKPRTATIQHFAPHNSWGFSSVRALPQVPHAFRVPFANADRGYQADERIVYADGYSSSNATLFETLNLPGVTNAEMAFKHARFHYAQLVLRPETYTIFTDFEHLVCTRGDLVRVTHDVPMWGLGSGRIKNRLSATQLELDEAVPMAAGVQYTIRLRQEDGSSLVRTVVAVAEDGNYTTITLSSSVNTTQGKPGLLFLFGALNSESVELVVHTIEPADNLTARLTLVDYSPAVYDSDKETLPPFASQITKPPVMLQKHITQKPTIVGLISNEGVMERLPGGSYDYGIKVTWSYPSNLPERVNAVQAEIDYANDNKEEWHSSQTLALTAKSTTFMGLTEGELYKIRLRFVDDEGRTGPWTISAAHTVVGKTTPPAKVTGAVATVKSSQIELKFDGNPEIDIVGYEIRTSDSAWGSNSGYLFRGLATSALVDPPPAGSARTWFIRAFDAANLYSETSALVSYTYGAVTPVTSATSAFSTTSLTNSTVTLDWNDVTPAFGLQRYRVVYGSVTKYVSASTITLPADWVGSRTFTISVQDRLGTYSAGYNITVTKSVPNAPTGITATPSVTGVLNLEWNEAVRTTLPIWGYEVRKVNSGWGGAGALFKGTVTKCTVDSADLALGNNTFFVKAIDTDGNYNTTAASFTYTVTAPADVASITHMFADTSLTNATVTLDWPNAAPPFGLSGYEVSYGNVVKTITANTITLPANWLGDRVFVVKVIDKLGNSSAGTSKSIAKLPPKPATNFRAQVIDNTVLFSWDLPTPTSLPIQHVVLKEGATYAGATLIGSKAGGFTTIQETASGKYTYWLAVVDTDGNESDPVSLTAEVAEPPDFVFNGEFISDFSGFKTQSRLDLDGSLLLPVSAAVYFTDFDSGADGWVGGGSATVSVTNGVLTWSSHATTTNGYFSRSFAGAASFYGSAAKKIAARVRRISGTGAWEGRIYYTNANHGSTNSFYKAAPAPAVLTDWNVVEWDMTTLTAGASSDWLDNLLTNVRVDLSDAAGEVWEVDWIRLGGESWERHFQDQSWNSPQSQVWAGYPVFIQPSAGSGFYEETFDYGTILSGSKVTLSYTGETLAGAVTITPQLSVSLDGTTWVDYPGSSSVYVSNFRYIKARVSVNETTGTGLYKMTELAVTLDAKLKDDGGTSAVVSTDAKGTVVNFNKEFLDIVSLTATPKGTALTTPVVDFQDAVLSGTYSVTSNVATVTVTGHELVAGQKVRLAFSSGTAITGVYTVASVVSANQFTVAMTTANTSGNVMSYPQGCRIYLFNSAGARVSGEVGWAAKGY